MADFRQFHSRFWCDSWVAGLASSHKLLYSYLFTNSRASACGLYEIPVRIISFETGLEDQAVKEGLDLFQKARKIRYDYKTGVVWVFNMWKYQGSESPKLFCRIEKDILAVPDCRLKKEFIDTVSVRYQWHIDTGGNGYRNSIDTTVSVSVSDSVSDLVKEGGVGGEQSEQIRGKFLQLFGALIKGEETKLLKLSTECDPEKLTCAMQWAQEKNIHNEKRLSLMDAIATAAANWQPPARRKAKDAQKEVVYADWKQEEQVET